MKNLHLHLHPRIESDHVMRAIPSRRCGMALNAGWFAKLVEGGAAKGMVDAVDVMNATMGDGEEGSGGWRTFWEQTMDVDDDESETSSLRSAGSALSKRPKAGSKLSLTATVNRPVNQAKVGTAKVGMSQNGRVLTWLDMVRTWP